MEKTSCNIIYDLLPLFKDDICSEESKNMVKEHLKNCEICRQNLAYMQEDKLYPEENDGAALKKIKNQIRRDKIMAGIAVFFATAIILGLLAVIGMWYLYRAEGTLNDSMNTSDIRIEEDTNGDVWLIRKGNATETSYVVCDMYTPEGDVISKLSEGGIQEHADFSHVVIDLQFYVDNASKLKLRLYGGQNNMEERSVLFNANEKTNFEKIVVTCNDETVTLWERKK